MEFACCDVKIKFRSEELKMFCKRFDFLNVKLKLKLRFALTGK